MARKPAPFPTTDQILEFIKETPGNVGKREIARAFRLDAEQKRDLKKVLRELEQTGAIEKGRKRRFREPGSLPEVAVLVVTGPDSEGDLTARPANWDEEDEPPLILMAPDRRPGPALGSGERVLARLAHAGDGAYQARVIRRLGMGPLQVMGIFRREGDFRRIEPIDRRARYGFSVQAHEAMDAKDGELVRAETKGGGRGERWAKVVERLGPGDGPGAISAISLRQHDIPVDFTPEAISQAEAAAAAPIDKREDLRDVPLVTIDGEDARDFDDAVFAESDGDGGWRLIVAIADVAWYVRPGDALDKCGYERGNSVYFPDRVVPMLPEALSNGWCSLRPHEERPCMAAHMRIDGDGRLVGHHFSRAVMRSAARLTYDQVQRARDGDPDEATGPLLETVIAPLYGAFEALSRAREGRGVLELDLPERRVMLDELGNVATVAVRPRWDSHKLIEEFMIAANVAAAETLERMKLPCMYRVHDEPTREKLDALREFLESVDLRLPRGQVIRPEQFNRILDRARGTPNERMVSEVILRSQAQAQYAPDNIGHFGLALRRYCHFTSPIRRYSDLLVHRALIAGLKAGAGGLAEEGDFDEMGEHLSKTERRAAAAERDAVDRFTASFLADQVGAVLPGRINGVTRFGLFVTLDESGGDGLVPMKSLPDDYWVHDEARHLLRGRHSGREFRLGETVEAMVMEANPVTGGLILQILDSGKPANGRKGKAKPTRKFKGGRQRRR